MSLSYLLIPFILVTLSLLAFYPSFNLGLFGDDWMTFWRYLQYLEPSSSGQWNHLSYFLTSYGPQDIIMGLLQKIYGYNALFYQLTSYTLRLLASFSLYPVAWYLTRNEQAPSFGSRLPAFFAVTFFSITSIGLETTAWVFNMPSYIAISFLNLFFYFYLKSHFEQKINLLILAVLLFTLAFLMQPIRMHGLLPFIMVMELFWLFQKLSKLQIKQFLIRIALFSSIFLILFLTLSKSPVAPTLGVSNEIFTTLLKLINEGNINYLLNPIKTIGSIFIPPSSNYNQQLFIGMAVVLVWILLIIKSRKDQKTQTALFFSFTWLISSFLFAWLRAPQSILNSTHRYFIVSAVGMALFLASITSIDNIKSNKNIIYLGVISLILVNIIFTRSYLKEQEKAHSIEVSNKIWDSMPYIEEVGKNDGPLVFYFADDGSNAVILRDVVTFGFPPHMALLYGITEENRTPIPMSDFKEVVSAVTDGKSFAPYSHPQKAIQVDRVYAFQLQGKDNLINITDIAREKLRTLK